MKAKLSSSSIRVKHLVALACAATACSAHAQTSTAKYELIDLGNLGGTYKSVVATGLNASGQVVGTGWKADGTAEAFVTGAWGQNMTSLGTLSGYASTTGAGINDHGQVVGTAYVDSMESGGQSRAFTYDAQGGLRALGNAGGLDKGQAINNQGQIAGTSRAPVGDGYYGISQMFVVNADGSMNASVGKTGVYTIAGITENGLIAGTYTQGSFLDSKGFTVHADGSGWTDYANSISGVNNLGQLATSTYETVRHGASGQYSTTLLVYAQTAINDQGLAGGYAGNGLFGGPYTNVFLKDAAGNVILSGWDFGTDKTAEGYPAWSYTGIPDINNAGDFIINGGNGHAYLARAVPEAGTVAYMALGLAGMGVMAARRRRQA